MKVEEFLERKRRDVLKSIQKLNITPEEITTMIDRTVDEVMHIFEKHNCKYKEIEYYFKENKYYAKLTANKMCEKRRDDIIQKIHCYINSIEKEIKQSKVQEDFERSNNETYSHKDNRESIDIETDERIYADNILRGLTGLIQELHVYGDRALRNRGYNDFRIQEIRNDINMYMKEISSSKFSEIEQILKRDTHQIVDRVKSEYEDHIEDMHREEQRYDNRSLFKTDNSKLDVEHDKNTEIKEDENSKFRKDLDSGKTLQDQKDFVDKVLEEKDKDADAEKRRQILSEMFK